MKVRCNWRIKTDVDNIMFKLKLLMLTFASRRMMARRGGFGRSGERESTSPPITCFKCRATGHTANHCPGPGGSPSRTIVGRSGERQSTSPPITCFKCRATGHTANHCPGGSPSRTIVRCYNCNEIGHTVRSCPMMTHNPSTITCFYCGEYGHKSKQCPCVKNAD